MALIPHDSHSDTWALTIQRQFIGPGCSVHELNVFLGRKLEGLGNKLVNLTGHHPSVLANRIEELFGSSLDDRQLKLDILHQDAGQIPKLRPLCIKLLDFARPSSSPETQCFTFEKIILLITRYPGLRRLFCNPSHKWPAMSNPINDISKDWKRTDCEPGKEWEFYREFAAFCLQTSALSEIVEKSKPNLLGRITYDSRMTSGQESSNLNPVPIEELLMFSRDGPDFTFSRLAATYYVAGILELPAFWTHCNNTREFHEVVNNICRTTLMLITDSDFDFGSDSPQETYPWMHASFNSIDALAHSLLLGLSRLNLVKLRLRDIDKLLAQLLRPVSQSRFPNAIRMLHSSPAIGYLLQSVTESLNNSTVNPRNLPYVSPAPSGSHGDFLLSDSVQSSRNVFKSIKTRSTMDFAFSLPTSELNAGTAETRTSTSLGREHKISRSMDQSSSGAGYALRIHHGAVDTSTITLRPPPEVIKHVKEVLAEMRVQVSVEGEYKVRCVRPKRAGTGVNTASGRVDSFDDMAYLFVMGSAPSNGVDKRGLPLPSSSSSLSNASLNTGGGMLRDLLMGQESSSQVSASAPLGPSTSFNDPDISIVSPISPASLSDPNHSSSGTAASPEPVYGPPTQDIGGEVRFSVELTKLDRLNDTYSLDIRRLKGNLRSYKFLYDEVRRRVDLR